MKHRAIGIVNKLYSSPSHKKKRTVYKASVHFRVEEIPDRPAVIDLFLCDVHVGDIAVLDDPYQGLHTATLPLNDAIDACNQRGITPGNYEDDMRVTIKTASGKDVPLSQITSMTMDIEDLTETPPTSNDDFPAITNRHLRPGHLKQYIKKLKQQIGGYGGGQQQGSEYDGGGQQQGSGYGGHSSSSSDY
ncbi:hypothetical protein HIM_07937 [Hirsutella minnesotensis 3608]|uniref:Uncharacterized protein n=1 Tax=Hirsutella minnesotensis 3608 TaxID=1043627 RepID=A0A0F7ZMX2_9HYPO|nr:hypothetical protein HIM_07937 [Hirsutella minnesotensis 3608]